MSRQRVKPLPTTRKRIKPPATPSNSLLTDKERKDRKADGRFSFGNQVWRLSLGKTGKPAAYTPETLWEAAIKYFTWVDDNPFFEAKFCQHREETWTEEIPKPRPYTQWEMCVSLNISEETYRGYRTNSAYVEVCSKIDGIIKSQKFAGAAAGFFNHAIIARDLGLADKRELTGEDGVPLIPAEADERAKKTRQALLATLL